MFFPNGKSAIQLENKLGKAIVNVMKFNHYVTKLGYAVAQLVEALRYKPESRGFDSRWNH
jgi:hypothetical protein